MVFPGNDEQIKKFQDLIMRRQMGEEEPAVETEAEPKPYAEALERFMTGKWIADKEWSEGLENRYDFTTEKWTPPKHAKEIHSLADSHIFTPESIQRGIIEWLTAEINDTNSLPPSSPARHLLTALRLLSDGREDQLDSQMLSALENGQKIFTDLAATRKATMVGMYRELPVVLDQKKGGRALIKDMGATAGAVYDTLLLPRLEPLFEAEKKRMEDIYAAMGM